MVRELFIISIVVESSQCLILFYLARYYMLLDVFYYASQAVYLAVVLDHINIYYEKLLRYLAAFDNKIFVLWFLI